MKLPAKIRNFNGRQAKKSEFFESSKNLENYLMGTLFWDFRDALPIRRKVLTKFEY